jgi:hypothetical protein
MFAKSYDEIKALSTFCKFEMGLARGFFIGPVYDSWNWEKKLGATVVQTKFERPKYHAKNNVRLSMANKPNGKSAFDTFTDETLGSLPNFAKVCHNSLHTFSVQFSAL